MLEQESCNLADRLIQGQVTRAEVEEDTFAIKRELAAIKQVKIYSWNFHLLIAVSLTFRLCAIFVDYQEDLSKPTTYSEEKYAQLYNQFKTKLNF